MALFGRKTTDGDSAADAGPTTDATTDATASLWRDEEAAATPTRRTLEEQRSFLLDKVGAMRPFGMQIWDVPGLVLCEDIESDLDLPLVTTARVGGWGVRGSDLVGATEQAPKRLFVVDTISVSDGPGRPLVSGAAVEIEEGAIIPEGVDAVVPAAAGRLAEDGYVEIGSEVRLYQNLRRAGSELADGTPLLRAGEVLTPALGRGARRGGPRQGARAPASARGRAHRRRDARRARPGRSPRRSSATTPRPL